jgi:hypothetical protein
LGRAVQAVQYGVALHAVGGVASPDAALITQGVDIIGATVGALVPNQMGATECAYDVFARAVGLGSEPARAVSIALLVRTAQVALAVLGFGVGMLGRRERLRSTALQ